MATHMIVPIDAREVLTLTDATFLQDDVKKTQEQEDAAKAETGPKRIIDYREFITQTDATRERFGSKDLADILKEFDANDNVLTVGNRVYSVSLVTYTIPNALGMQVKIDMPLHYFRTSGMRKKLHAGIKLSPCFIP